MRFSTKTRSFLFSFFFFKQKTAYEITVRDWSSDVCSSDLEDGCSRCADAVCEKNPFCCGPQVACAHDPCEVGTGAPLNPRCDTCVNAVCEEHPECCDDVWNEACVSYVATECAPLGQSCGCPAGGVDGGASCVLVGEETNYDWFAANAGCQEKYGFG